MRILLVGAGGVGGAFTAIAARRDFFETVVIADYDPARAATAAATDDRYVAAQVDASSAESVTALCRTHRITHVMNAVDPVFAMSIFNGAFAAGADYLDMAMSLSKPHPESPYEKTGVKLGDEQFAVAGDWEAAGRLALVGMGVEPGLSDVFARYAADHLFAEIDELGTRDGANLVVTDEAGNEIFAPSFSMWTTIEECLNPPVIWQDGGWHTTAPFSEPEVFDFPEGIGPVECVNVEHEEVLLMPRWIDCRRATFKYGLGEELITILKVLHALGLDRTEKVRVKGVEVSPRDVVAAVLPDPATVGPRMTGKTCAGLWVTGTGKDADGNPTGPRSTYLFHVVDNEQTMAEYGHQCVVWQTAINPVIALELLATGVWQGAGVLGPEAFDAVPFLDLLTAYGSPWGQREQ
ncbi:MULTISPECIES: saccharopine dehydrogenase family protein [unclassified Nocardioides]|uniref:saccharopine dehydrogenase family protein n=1 Tax=unclassified Nocardioides TaxID=2615069 RepID=UPI0006F353BC|nr:MULTISPECIES: saccharopine dehydrogenase C-terminal domain-containing protein [unclassified Nocardioides]KRA32461.1 ATP-binding protein [Nocardioides sp. Root614]KRA89114.1 ATP-binding protein [Nocardioides sp. Root682]